MALAQLASTFLAEDGRFKIINKINQLLALAWALNIRQNCQASSCQAKNALKTLPSKWLGFSHQHKVDLLSPDPPQQVSRVTLPY
jgi:hypothetical protein